MWKWSLYVLFMAEETPWKLSSSSIIMAFISHSHRAGLAAPPSTSLLYAALIGEERRSLPHSSGALNGKVFIPERTYGRLEWVHDAHEQINCNKRALATVHCWRISGSLSSCLFAILSRSFVSISSLSSLVTSACTFLIWN